MSIPKNTVSTPDCTRFSRVSDAIRHAREWSRTDKFGVRFVIETGDYYFSSTTAQIFWYEKLLYTFRNGAGTAHDADRIDLN